MRIGIVGSGSIGSTVARLAVAAGHEVALANRRGPESLALLVEELGPQARAGTVEEAARFGDLVLVSIPFGEIGTLPAPAFAGRVVVDSNNYYPNRDGHVPEIDADETTSSELLAAHLPDATVVKAFNTMYYKYLAEGGEPAKPLDQRQALFVAGDDAAAKALVGGLIETFGYAPVDTGGLAEGGRLQQPGSPIYPKQMTAAEARSVLEGLRS